MIRRDAVSLLLAATLALAAAQASAETLTVDARANIFAAGHAAPPSPGGGGGGILPPSTSFVASPALILMINAAVGTVSCCANLGTLGNGADGGAFGSGNTDITAFEGVSGIADGTRTMFLVGVFTDGSEPADPAPTALDFGPAGLGDAFDSLSPELNQIFMIGDGLTGHGSGDQQVFRVPENATTLYLGFADADDFGNPVSAPGWYDDNLGSLEVAFDIQPDATPTYHSSWGSLKTHYR